MCIHQQYVLVNLQILQLLGERSSFIMLRLINCVTMSSDKNNVMRLLDLKRELKEAVSLTVAVNHLCKRSTKR